MLCIPVDSLAAPGLPAAAVVVTAGSGASSMSSPCLALYVARWLLTSRLVSPSTRISLRTPMCMALACPPSLLTHATNKLCRSGVHWIGAAVGVAAPGLPAAAAAFTAACKQHEPHESGAGATLHTQLLLACGDKSVLLASEQQSISLASNTLAPPECNQQLCTHGYMLVGSATHSSKPYSCSQQCSGQALPWYCMHFSAPSFWFGTYP